MFLFSNYVIHLNLYLNKTHVLYNTYIELIASWLKIKYPYIYCLSVNLALYAGTIMALEDLDSLG